MEANFEEIEAIIGATAKLNWQLPPEPLFHAGCQRIGDFFQMFFNGPF
jgi:hypothetical protein